MTRTRQLRLALVTVLLVCAAEVGVIGVFHVLQLRAESAGLLISGILAGVNRLDGLEWQAIYRAAVPSELEEDMRRARAQTLHRLSLLAEVRRETLPADTSIQEAYRAYTRAVDLEMGHLRSGRLAEARRVDEDQVDPASDRLRGLLEGLEVIYQARALRFRRWDSWVTFLSLALATGANLVLLKYWLTASEIRAKAETDRRLREESERTQMEVRALNAGLEARIAERTDALLKANQSLIAEMAQRKGLEQAISQLSEDEKRRLGEDLHDGVGQILAGALMRSKTLEGELRTGSTPDLAEVVRLTELLATALQSTRGVSSLLYPMELESEGLVTALRIMAQRLSEQFGVPCHVDLKASVSPDMKGALIELYRIAQEAVTNAMRHGRCSWVRVRLRWSEEMVDLQIENDGPEIAPQPGDFDGMGCRIMRYRANLVGATLSINPRQEGGCLVSCHRNLRQVPA